MTSAALPRTFFTSCSGCHNAYGPSAVPGVPDLLYLPARRHGRARQQPGDDHPGLGDGGAHQWAQRLPARTDVRDRLVLVALGAGLCLAAFGALLGYRAITD